MRNVVRRILFRMYCWKHDICPVHLCGKDFRCNDYSGDGGSGVITFHCELCVKAARTKWIAAQHTETPDCGFMKVSAS